MSIDNEYKNDFKKYIEKEKTVIELINFAGKLLYEKGVELVFFRRHLIDINITEILRLHHYAKNFVKKPISVFETSKITQELYKLNLCPSKIDVGKLTHEWIDQKENFKNHFDFLSEKLNFLINNKDVKPNPKDVVLYGFGDSLL